jgi:hypothetical protein
MSYFDGAVLYGVEHLQARHDFTGGEKLDLEFVVGGPCDAHDLKEAAALLTELA